MTPAEQLTSWIALKYEGRLIRQSTEPYFNHLIVVAEMIKPLIVLGYEIGVCHDLLEDTETTAEELLEILVSFGYNDTAARYITNCVIELTDVYSAAAYPYLSKAERKEKEAARLTGISPAAQTVKYGDLLYNIGWVVLHDKKRKKKYLKRKQALIGNMVTGDTELRQKLLAIIDNALMV